MADYILEVPLTNKGRDVMDPDILDSIISEGVYMIPRITYNNLNVDTSTEDYRAAISIINTSASQVASGPQPIASNVLISSFILSASVLGVIHFMNFQKPVNLYDFSCFIIFLYSF